jgi:hypothetical protein
MEYPIPGVLGIERTVPEFARNPQDACDPFPIDVYYLGSMVEENFLKVRANRSPDGLRPFTNIPLEADWLRVLGGPRNRHG